MLIEEITHISNINKQFLITLPEILGFRCLTPKLWVPSYAYGSFECSPELTACIQEQFNTDVQVRYQVALKDLAPHVDICKQEYKYIYVYNTGGSNVNTTFWKEDGSCINKICKSNTWYKLHVKTLHSVVGLIAPRLSITVKEIDE